MLHSRRSLLRYQFNRRLTYYLLLLLILFSALSICLIISYGINIISQKNVVLLTVFHRRPEEKQTLPQHQQHYQNLTKRGHVLSTNKQLRDWHKFRHITRDQSRQQQQQQQEPQPQQKHQQQPDPESQQRQSFDFVKIGQSAIAKSTSKSQKRFSGGKSWQTTGFNVELSERLSLQRLVPDTRHESCKTKLYPATLPSCSIIIVYHQELNSVVLRTLHSIFDRTPEELLHEVILVDDFSQTNTSAKLNKYISDNFAQWVHHIHLNQREGLIRARLEGARHAQGEVLLFLDAHVEVNLNWLPPLLASIEEDPFTTATPIIDLIKYDTFEYETSMPSRGGFNWQFNYVQLPLLKNEEAVYPEPHNNPIMNGGLFAIRRDYFWYLGGYDEGLEIWGAEQYELSFKIWLCGGRLLEVPCSRVGHLYRSPEFRVKYTEREDDFISKNYKRVAEVWMDEFKEYLYEHIPKLTQIDAGNLAKQKELRHQLKCKSFKWFMEHIAYDLLKAYPPLKPPDFANGAIRSLALPQLCLDMQTIGPRQMLQDVLRPCSPDLKHPYANQRWHLGFRKDLQHQGNCLEVQKWSSHAPIWLWPCHNRGGNQYWYYDRNTRMLVQGNTDYNQRCLEVNSKSLKIFLNYCDFVKLEQKWEFGWVNETAMDRFFNAD